MSGSEKGCSKTVALLREGITVGSLDLSDKAVSAEQTDLASTLGGDLAPGIIGEVATDGMQKLLWIVRSNATLLSMSDKEHYVNYNHPHVGLPQSIPIPRRS